MLISIEQININEYNSMLFDAEGIILKLATSAVKKIISNAVPKYLPTLVFVAQMDIIIIIDNIIKTTKVSEKIGIGLV